MTASPRPAQPHPARPRPGRGPGRGDFILACHGWSGSKWVAYALNRHPRIACGHTSAAILADRAIEFDADAFDTLLPAARRGYEQRRSRPMAETYAALAAQKPAEFTGTVHTYRLRDLAPQAERFPPGRTYPVMNLVRHPLDLVVSGYRQFQDLFRADIKEFAWTLNKVVDQGLEIVEDVCARHWLAPGDYDHVCFFGACVVLGSLRLDLDAAARLRADPGGPWDWRGAVRMEDVTRDRAAFADLVARLTGAPDLADSAYLDAVFRTGAINRHDRGPRRGTLDRWAALAPWQREAFAAFLDRFRLRPDYERLGYDFGFLDACG